MKKIKLGFVGLGNVVSVYHFPAVQEFPDDFEIAAGCDLDLEKKDIVESQGGVFAASLDAMMQMDIDIFVVATPPKSHYQIAKILLEAGKTILLEKPATETLEQFEHLLGIAGENQLHFAFHFAGSADTRGFRDWMKEQNTSIESFRVHLNDPHVISTKFDIDEAGIQLGGVYLDLAANALSVLDALGVRGLEMINRYQIFSPDSPDIDFHTYCELVGETVSGTITLDWSAGLNCKGLNVLCSDGWWHNLNNSEQSVTAFDGRLIIPACEGDRLVNHYIGVYADFLENLKQGTTNLEMAKRINDIFFQFYDLPNGPGYCHK